MPAKNNTVKKAAKSDLSKIMDDTPLFAGLDDYILSQSVRIKAEESKASRIKEKKKTTPRQSKQEKTESPVHKKVPKVKGAPPPAETRAVLLSVAEMCTLLKISRATLVRIDKSGKIPGKIKLGGSIRFHRDTVESWLQNLITTHLPPD